MENENCDSSVSYYGIGRISKIGDGIITMKGEQNQELDLRAIDCTISMSTSDGHVPEAGDVICWKGYRK